jgi:hypothetical protein
MANGPWVRWSPFFDPQSTNCVTVTSGLCRVPLDHTETMVMSQTQLAFNLILWVTGSVLLQGRWGPNEENERMDNQQNMMRYTGDTEGT